MGLHCLRPFRDLLSPLPGGHGQQLAVIEGVSPPPAGEVAPVEQGRESGGRHVEFGGFAGQRQQANRRREKNSSNARNNRSDHGIG
jgi:hypothetical protein